MGCFTEEFPHPPVGSEGADKWRIVEPESYPPSPRSSVPWLVDALDPPHSHFVSLCPRGSKVTTARRAGQHDWQDRCARHRSGDVADGNRDLVVGPGEAAERLGAQRPAKVGPDRTGLVGEARHERRFDHRRARRRYSDSEASPPVYARSTTISVHRSQSQRGVPRSGRTRPLRR